MARSVSSNGARIVVVGGGHRCLEAGDEFGAGRCRVDAFAALVAVLGAAFDEAAALEALEEARDTGRARAADLCDVALDGTGVLLQVAEREACSWLRSRSRTQSSPALRWAHPIQRTSSRLLLSVFVTFVHDQNSNCLISNCQPSNSSSHSGWLVCEAWKPSSRRGASSMSPSRGQEPRSVAC